MTTPRSSHRVLLFAAFLSGIVVAGVGAAKDGTVNLKALRGGRALDQTSTAPDNTKQSTPRGGFGRAYRQQPPLIPHSVDNYQITTTNNPCMGCHDWPGNIAVKAPKVSETHYVDRQGVRLDQIAGTRYFCRQCHVPQSDARPLVDNTFKNATQVE